MREKSSLSSPKFQDVANLEYQVDPAHAEDDEGALNEGEGGPHEKFYDWYHKLGRQSKGMGIENYSTLKTVCISFNFSCLFFQKILIYRSLGPPGRNF